MAGDIKRQRKSWTLHDRSKVSLFAIRANLAEDGCELAQYDMGKKLLEELESAPDVPENTKNENARLAIYWLIKSSEQGNDEATQLLQECLQSGRGLTAQNILDVRTCVTTPKHEKLTFKAARLLHRKLSNGEEFITTAQLLGRITTVSRKNVTFQHSNGSILHQDIHPSAGSAVDRSPDQDNNPVGEQQEDEEKEENSTDSGTSASTPEQSEAPTSTATPHPLLKDIRLNETFIVSGRRNNATSSSSIPPPPSFIPTSQSSPTKNTNSKRMPSSPPSPLRNNAPTPAPRNYSALNHTQNSIITEVQSAADLKLAMMQTGRKLTLQDLLDVAKDFNKGKATGVCIDERNKILGRHRWELNSFLNTFFLQLVFLCVVGKVLHFSDALVYLILLGMAWSAYNLLLWKLRYHNFKDWAHAFESVLKEESWETERFTQRLSHRYMTPYLVTLSIGLFLLTFLKPHDTDPIAAVLIVAVGILAMISIQFGVLHRVLPSCQQILILSSTLIYYRSSIVTGLLGESITEQTRFLHEPLISFGGDSLYNLSMSITPFLVLICTCLSTTVKLSLGRIFCETIPEIVLTLWLLKFVGESAECEINEFTTGIGVGLLVYCGMALLASKMELWKVIISLGVMTLGGLILTGVWTMRNAPASMEPSKMKFLEWEDYDMSCHRKAWSVQSPAATQIKCSSLYDEQRNPTMVKWKGRVSIVKVEKLSRSFMSSSSSSIVEDVVFDIAVGIFTGGHAEDKGTHWQNFLSSSSGSSEETVAPASIILKTNQIPDRKRRQVVMDHVLSLRSGDRVEFIGVLKGSTAGSLKPHIVHLESIQCINCATADYGEVIVRDHGKIDWVSLFREALSFWKASDSDNVKESGQSDFLNQYKNMLYEFISEVKKLIGS